MAKKRPGIGVARLAPDDRQFLEERTFEAFVEFSNRGVSFKRALLGVYLTGVDDAKGILLENVRRSPNS